MYLKILLLTLLLQQELIVKDLKVVLGYVKYYYYCNFVVVLQYDK